VITSLAPRKLSAEAQLLLQAITSKLTSAEKTLEYNTLKEAYLQEKMKNVVQQGTGR